MNRRTFTSSVALASLSLALPARSQAYPAHSTRLIVPYGPGNVTDLLSRLVADRLGDAWKFPVVVENITGAGGVVGTAELASSTPDGYTVGMVSVGHTMAAAVFPKLPFDPLGGFTPIIRLTSNPFVYVANPTLPARTLEELISLAKSQPGKIDYATPGNGGAPHFAIEMLAHRSGIKLTHVPYRSIGQAVTDVLSGQVSLICASIPIFLPHIKTGRLNPLAVTGDARSSLLPDVPTVAESGLKDFEFKSWNGLLAPADVPAPIVSRLYESLAEIVSSQSIKSQLASRGVDVDILDPDAFSHLLRTEVDLWRGIAKAADIRVG